MFALSALFEKHWIEYPESPFRKRKFKSIKSFLPNKGQHKRWPFMEVPNFAYTLFHLKNDHDVSEYTVGRCLLLCVFSYIQKGTLWHP